MIRLRHDRWVIWLAPGRESDGVLAAVDSFDRKAADVTVPAELWLIHAGGRSSIHGVRWQGNSFCLKVFTDQRFHVRMRNFLGFSKGLRAFRNGLRANALGLPVPHVYAYAEQRHFGPTMVIMELLENAVQMNLLLEERLKRGIVLTSDPVFLDLTERFAIFTGELHAKGVCHRDYSPRNVLVAESGGQARLQLIDLEDLDFTCTTRKFRRDIRHFHDKMSRYVDPTALALFENRFSVHYGKVPPQ